MRPQHINLMKTLISVCLFCLLANAQAQAIYKTIDAQGNISYSTTKPDKAENVEIIDAPREPSQTEIEAAHQRQAELEKSRETSRERRSAQELEKNIKAKKSQQKRQKNKGKNNDFPGLLF